jgi:hypothetical protein
MSRITPLPDVEDDVEECHEGEELASEDEAK